MSYWTAVTIITIKVSPRVAYGTIRTNENETQPIIFKVTVAFLAITLVNTQKECVRHYQASPNHCLAPLSELKNTLCSLLYSGYPQLSPLWSIVPGCTTIGTCIILSQASFVQQYLHKVYPRHCAWLEYDHLSAVYNSVVQIIVYLPFCDRTFRLFWILQIVTS